MKSIVSTALALALTTPALTAPAWATETGPVATPVADAATTAVQLSEAEMDTITAGVRYTLTTMRIVSFGAFGLAGTLPTPQRSGFDLQYSLFGGPIFTAPPGCGGFGAEFGC